MINFSKLETEDKMRQPMHQSITAALPMAGFTMIELMVTLAVAGILMGLALPAFNGFIDQRNMAAQGNEMILAFALARSEAANRGTTVSVQAADPSASTNEWGPGYCVVLGTPGNCTTANTVLRRFEGADDNTFNETINDDQTFSFNSRGLLISGTAAAIALCSTDTSEDPGRNITISVIGRASTGELVCHP